MNAVPEHQYLPKGFHPEPELLEQLSSRPGNQRCLIGHDELLLVVHEVPEPKVPEREALIFWRHPPEGWLGPDGSKGLGAMNRLLDRFQEAVDSHEALIDEADTAAEVFAIIRHSGPLARTMRNLVLALEQALVHDDDDRELINLRDRARDIERAAELLYHDAKLTLDFWQAESAEDQQEATVKLNKIMFRLNLMAGFFLPMVALGGLFGMNVDLPAFVKPMFWAILAGGLLMGLIVLVVVGWRTYSRK